MNKLSKLINSLLVVLWSALFALAANAGPDPQANTSPLIEKGASTGYEPLGDHQNRECQLIRMLGGQLPPRCLPEFENWRQSFEDDTAGWVTSADPGPTGWCGEIERINISDLMCEADEIRPLSGDNHAIVRHGQCNDFFSETFPDGSGPASSLRLLNESFPEGGFTSSVNIYLDPGWAEGAEFGYADAFQDLDAEFPNFRYLFIPVARTETGLFVGEFQVTEAGWYTFSTVYSSGKGNHLSAEFVLSRHDWPLYSQSHDVTLLSEEPVDSFKTHNTSSAYIWFVYISPGLDLAIDEEQMRAGR
ncbi:hypothetical protein [Wenzhouxiangella sp. 15190]|nr:hypothetical protein [Wenzhouxiangella sp. 15190]